MFIENIKLEKACLVKRPAYICRAWTLIFVTESINLVCSRILDAFRKMDGVCAYIQCVLEPIFLKKCFGDLSLAKKQYM